MPNTRSTTAGSSAAPPIDLRPVIGHAGFDDGRGPPHQAYGRLTALTRRVAFDPAGRSARPHRTRTDPARRRCSNAWRRAAGRRRHRPARRPAADRARARVARSSTCRTRSRRGRRRPSRWALDFTRRVLRRPGRGDRDDVVAAPRSRAAARLRRSATLSKGQRKRALLAIGLLTPQPVLLADEPFDGLDLRQSREVARDAARPRRGRAHAVPVDPPDHRRGARVRSVRAAERRPRARRRDARRAVGAAHARRAADRAVERPISKRCSLRSRRDARSLAGCSTKEWRELIASRSWWVMLLAIGPLVGVSFISAVRTYAEASGLNGTAVGVGEAFSPLIGIWAPTFSACELAAAFLLPFVAIRLVAGDRQSGALKIELQQPMPAFARIARKGAGAARRRGSSRRLAPLARGRCCGRATAARVYPPELATVLLGHLLERRPDHRARRGRRVDDRASVHRRDPDARRHGRHVDRRISSRRCRAASGSARPATRRRRWSPSSSTG